MKMAQLTMRIFLKMKKMQQNRSHNGANRNERNRPDPIIALTLNKIP